MEAPSYKLSAGQVACLSAVAAGRYRVCNRCADYPQAVSLTDKFADAGDQALRNACVVHAVTALVEYFEDGKNRLSAQYLIEVTRLSERDWLKRNLDALAQGRPCEADFAAAFEGPVAQVRMLVAANGAKSPATASFIDSFGRQIARRLAADNGTRIRRAFEALEKYGICRFRLWPYANVASVAEVADGAFPPGAHEDARKHRVVNGLYILRAPNNVDEIRGILSGANGRRRMPVCVGVDVFEGCDGATFAFPTCDPDGRVASFKGIHEMLLVGYRDDKSFAGGGFFIVRNSWGTDWGKDGYGRIPYAYIECFCREAGTILQDLVDYVGERGLSASVKTGHPVCAASGWSLAAAALVGGGVWACLAHREQVRVAPEEVVASETNVIEAVVEAVTNVVEVVSDATNVVETVSEATNVVEAISEPVVVVPETNEATYIEAKAPVLRASPRIAPATQLASLGGYVSPCETTSSSCATTHVSTAELQDLTHIPQAERAAQAVARGVRHGATESVQTNVEARVVSTDEVKVAEPEPPVIDPEPPAVDPTPLVVDPTPPVIEPILPVLRASKPPCETPHIVVAEPPKPPVEKVPQHILISAAGLDSKVYGFLLRKFYRTRDVSIRRGEAKGLIVVTARTHEPIRAALSERFAVEETDAAHWNVREKPREYAFSMRFFCESREEFDALRACLMRTDVPFAVEILSSPNGDVRWLDATVTFRSPDGKVPDARRCVADFLLKSGADGERADWLAPNKIRSIQKL